MPTKQRFAFAFMLVVIVGVAIAVAGCGTRYNVELSVSPNDEPVKAPEETHTTTEWLRLARLDYDAWKLDEALKKVLAVQPEENEQNQSQYRDYYEDMDDIEVLEALEKNEFYQKDLFLVKLANRFLANKQSELAVVAARHISPCTMRRDLTLVTIVKAQIKAAETAMKPDGDGNVDEMLDQAALTASYLGYGQKNVAYELVSTYMAFSGRFFDAVDQAANIPDSQIRNAQLTDLTRRYVEVRRWYNRPATAKYKVVRIDAREPVYLAIIARMDDPKHKILAFLNLAAFFGSRDAQNNIISPKKCEEYLAAVLDTFDTIEKPDKAELNMLARAAAFYETLEMNEKAKSGFRLNVIRKKVQQ